jgi:hypothetical protein
MLESKTHEAERLRYRRALKRLRDAALVDLQGTCGPPSIDPEWVYEVTNNALFPTDHEK